MFNNIVSSPRGSLSPQQSLRLAKLYLETACNVDDSELALVLCHDTEVSLYQAKKTVKRSEDQFMLKEIATVYTNLGSLLDKQGRLNEAKASYKKAGKLGVSTQDSGQLVKISRPSSIASTLRGSSFLAGVSKVSGPIQAPPTPPPSQPRPYRNVAIIPAHIFTENLRPPAIEYILPGPDERLINTYQLAGCLYLLQEDRSSDDVLDPSAQNWLETTQKDPDEQERLKAMSTEVVRAFKRDEIKDAKAIAEVVCLAPALDKDTFQDLLSEFYSGIDHSGLLKFHQVDGLAQLIQGADLGHLSADDLVKILQLLSKRLRDTHQQSSHNLHRLTLAVSHVLDAMADTKVKGLDREKLHEPLSAYLNKLMNNSDPYLVYQAAYAFQALLWVPDDETTWHAAMRRTGKVIHGISGLVSAVKGLDLVKFIDGLGDIQKGFEGAARVVAVIKDAYVEVTVLAHSGQSFLKSLKEGLSFERKRDWYSALRGADALIRDGDVATFRRLVCEVPCRLDPAFQWGVCQRLAEIAVNPMWDPDTRQDAVDFMGEIYKNDEVWGQHACVKQWILNTLMQLTLTSGAGSQLVKTATESLLSGLRSNGGVQKQMMYRLCREKGSVAYPMKVPPAEQSSSSLLDRVQNRPDVEGSVRLLRKQRTKERGGAVYIPPQAKASLQAADTARFPLMENVKEFLESDQKVFLLMGDSGAGKSTFNRELEFELWQTYKKKTGRIPLHINLPAIDKPEHDMIAKQLRRAEFTEPQIREMKHHRKFILICDGYDESQQTYNLYMSNRLNQEDEWNAQMVISCRTEYLGADYRDRFQPFGRDQQSDPSLYKEAVITPFSLDQVQAYIQQYVFLHEPLWHVEDYRQALELIPSLKELMKNPFLMTLSLEVLPRMVDPGQHLSKAHVTRVGLYDHFVEQWLERGKKRHGEKDLSSQARAAFESLSDEGFALNGIEYLKKLAVAIYKQQSGHPIVEYSRLIDKGSWKDEFFSGKDHQILREASPLTRSGNQHRFIHRSLLEYALARAVFDPQDRRKLSAMRNVKGRRGSVSSALSFELEDSQEDVGPIVEQEPDINSPLVWRSFVDDHSLMQFLEERAQQEPVFKKELHAYIQYSKRDKKWRKAAANAITILVRAGEQFIGADLNDVRIPGADLSYGMFDSTQLQNADLRKVILRSVWLRQADLSGAQMMGVQFGELPYLTEGKGIRSCAYSPDGKSIALGFFHGRISVYSTSSWEIIQTLSGHSNVVQRVVYSPTGDMIASASMDETIRLWDMETGVQLHVLKEHTSIVTGIAYSPLGDMVASASSDKTVRIWDVMTGDCLKVLSGHTGEVFSVAYSPSGNQIASCSVDYTIRLWDVETGMCARVLSGHTNGVYDVAYSPHGDQIASASSDKTVRLWDKETGTTLHTLTGHTNIVVSVAYSPNGDQVVSGSKDSTLRIWNVDTGSCRHTLTGHMSPAFAVSYSPRGDQVASASGDKTLRLWDASADSSRLVSSGHSASVESIRCSPKGDLIVSGSSDNTMHLWDAETGSCRQSLGGHNGTVFGVAYSPNGKWVASGGGIDKSVRLWKMESGKCQHVLTGHTNWVHSVAFSLKGDMVASGSEDKTVRVWKVATGDCSKILNGHSGRVNSVAFAPNGKQIATGSDDCTIRLWDIGTGEYWMVLREHTNSVRQVAYSPQGNQLASAGSDMTVRLWDAQTGECRMTLTDHTSEVRGVTYSSNGQLVASGSMDKTVRLWDALSGECRAVVENFPDSIYCVDWYAFNDVNYLVTGCKDGSLLKWEVYEEEEQLRVQLQWSAANGSLTVIGASIQGVHGLTALNHQLLKQREAVGEPEFMSRRASKRLITIAPMMMSSSRLRQSPEGTMDDYPSVANTPMEKTEQFGYISPLSSGRMRRGDIPVTN